MIIVNVIDLSCALELLLTCTGAVGDRGELQDNKACPVYVRKENSIRAHFLTCFIALLMVRLLEKKIDHKLNHSEIANALQSAMAAEVDDGIYKNIVSSKAMDVMGKTLGLDLTKAWYSAKEIRSLAAKPRKS